jgi:phosphatidylserine decarboxylase precursor
MNTVIDFPRRKLKPSARPVEEPENPYRLVSGADCRLMAFDSVNEATRLWIKGREFTIARLLGDAYKEEADRYIDGSLAIFRLAPQDYHRFHSPVDGVIGHMTQISGEYYTVNVSYPLPFFLLLIFSVVLSRKQSALLSMSTVRTYEGSCPSIVFSSVA